MDGLVPFDDTWVCDASPAGGEEGWGDPLWTGGSGARYFTFPECDVLDCLESGLAGYAPEGTGGAVYLKDRGFGVKAFEGDGSGECWVGPEGVLGSSGVGSDEAGILSGLSDGTAEEVLSARRVSS